MVLFPYPPTSTPIPPSTYKRTHIALALSNRRGVALSFASDEPKEVPFATPEVWMLELAAALVVFRFVEPVDVELSEHRGGGRIHGQQRVVS